MKQDFERPGRNESARPTRTLFYQVRRRESFTARLLEICISEHEEWHVDDEKSREISTL